MAEYLQNKTASAAFEENLITYIPAFESYRVQPFSRTYMNSGAKIVNVTPVITKIGLYTVEMKVRSWENSLVYGIALEETSTSKNVTIIS